MPTPFIHAAVSTAAAELSGRPGFNRRVFWIFLFAANMADLDVIPGLLMGNLLLYHHHFTHSPAFALLVAFALSFIPWGDRPVSIRLRFLALAAATLSHPFLDLLTYDRFSSFKGDPSGIMLAWPFSLERWKSWPVFQGLYVTAQWRDWLHLVNLKVYAIEAALGGALWAGAKYLRPPVFWPRPKPEPVRDS